MIVAALCIDIMQALLSLTLFGMFVTPIITGIAVIMFGIWFSHHGMSMLEPRRILAYGATTLVELSPFGFLPVWTLSVSLTLFFAKKELEADAEHSL